MNRLANVASPYLRQHAGHPVDWHPWGPEALELARRTRKPILLSIGYSACHWCHVMAHESFADPDTAALMNARYINIKVDREERPDLDRIYQNAHLLLAQRHGGWPLTVMLTPEQVPFFAGTYFPDRPRHGLPAFRQVLQRVADFLEENPQEIADQNARLLTQLTRLHAPQGGDLPGPAALDGALAPLRRQFDAEEGGFGAAPKFPHPATLSWLEWRFLRRGDRGAGAMLGKTLQGMAAGGLLDQVGGGFFRYSVDRFWTIPHFEKMLYDQGPLLALYAGSLLQSRATADPRDLPEWAVTPERASEVLELTVGWLTREMRSPQGAFHASLDADAADGEEGGYYVWDAAELAQCLPEPVHAVASRVWGWDGKPNFAGRWHLRVQQEPADAARAAAMDPVTLQNLLQQARTQLLSVRARRAPPHRDDKILTAWNALTISGLVRAATALEREDWLDLAAAALQEVRRLLWHEGRLYASVCEAYPAPLPPAYLDDHAYLLAALLDLMRARFDPALLQWAQQLADILLRDFQDVAEGGFHFTAIDHEPLIQRPKIHADDAQASGNGVAALALLQLGFLLVEPRYLQAAEGVLRNAGPAMQDFPLAHMTLLQALDVWVDPPPLLLLRGPQSLGQVWTRAILERAPTTWVYRLPADARGLPYALAGKCGMATSAERIVAYVCRGTHCFPPAYELDAVLAML
jgi:uncharacterized protein YyaL (SSP411 family)